MKHHRRGKTITTRKRTQIPTQSLLQTSLQSTQFFQAPSQKVELLNQRFKELIRQRAIGENILQNNESKIISHFILQVTFFKIKVESEAMLLLKTYSRLRVAEKKTEAMLPPVRTKTFQRTM